MTFLNVLSFARSFRKLTAIRSGTGKLDDPDLKTLDGIKVILFIWSSLWLGFLYNIDLIKYSNISEFLRSLVQENKAFYVFISCSQIVIDFFIMLSAFFMTYTINHLGKEYYGISLGLFI